MVTHPTATDIAHQRPVLPAPIPISTDTHAIARIAAFMYCGFEQLPQATRDEVCDVLGVGYDGVADVADMLVDFAAQQWALECQFHDTYKLDYSGVIEYEVSEPFGMKFGERIFADSQAYQNSGSEQWRLLRTQLAAMVEGFFVGPDDDPGASRPDTAHFDPMEWRRELARLRMEGA